MSTKYYTCRFVVDATQARFATSQSQAVGMCLKPTVTDDLCQAHEDERLAEIERRTKWPLWP